MFIKSLLVIAGCLVIMPLMGHAAPLIYDESVDGDLNDQTLLLDAGINTISGDWTLIYPNTSDKDSFWFTIPQDMELTNVTYTFDDSSVTMPFGWALLSQYTLLPYTADRGNLVLPGTASPQNFFESSLPISDGTHLLVQHLSFSQTDFPPWALSTGDGGTIPYTWSFTVEPTVVPVPAAVWLFASGLLGLITVVRRKENA